MKKILIVTYGGGHVNIINQILLKSKSIKSFEIHIITLTSAKNKIFNQDYKIYNLIDFKEIFSSQENLKINHYGNILLNENHNPESAISIEESIFYLGTSMYDLVIRKGEKMAFEDYRYNGRQSFFPVNIMEKIINYIKPNLLLTTNSPRFEAASIMACKKLLIPSVQILDLFGDDFPTPSADYIIVMSDRVKQKLKKYIKKSKILSLGQPALLKTISDVAQRKSSQIKKEIGLNNNTKVITFATSPYVEYDMNYKIIKHKKINPYNEEIIEILKKFISLDYKIILKTHPVSDLSSNYKKFVDNKNIFLIDNKKHDICDVLCISDCLISFNSTTLLEAVLCGKSAVSFNYKEENIYNVSAYKEKPFFHAPSLDFLYENIKSSLKINNGYDEDFYTPNFHSNFDNLIKKF